MPNPLTLKNGRKVTDPKAWSNLQRPEIVEDSKNEIYGRLPRNIPSVKWKIISTTDTTVGNYPIKQKYKGVADNSFTPHSVLKLSYWLLRPATSKHPVH